MLIKEVLSETYDKNRAPYGVIFHGDKKAYVGSAHGKNITMSKDLKEKLTDLIKKYGIWYEGAGGDIENHKRFFGFGKSGYDDSWDDVFERSISGYPYQYLYTIFSNVDVNNQNKNLTNSNKTIFDSILHCQNKVGYFQDGRKFNKDTLTKFLKEISDSTHDFLKMSKDDATKSNVKKFLSIGEKRMWPNNWEEYPHNAGKVAKKANSSRDKWVLNQKSGVYVMGSGHLLDLKKLNNSLKIIDGDKI